MDTQKKVSIIIPVYGVEAYLEECINSLLNQTYTNLEIIVIDDASPDRCPEICDLFRKMDKRVKVIHKSNGGAASARNKGLDILTGEYFTFVDSDDYVKPTYIEELLKHLVDNDADISVCSFEYLYKNKRVVRGYQGSLDKMNQTEFLKRFLSDWTCGIIWNKLFKTELLGGIRFPEGHKIDDEFFTYKLVMNAKNVVLFESVLYEYRMRSSSVMKASVQNRLLLDKIQYLCERYEFVVEVYPQLKKEYLEDLVDSLIRLKTTSGKYYDVQTQLKSKYREYFWIVMLSSISYKKKYSFLRTSLYIKSVPEKDIANDEDILFE